MSYWHDTWFGVVDVIRDRSKDQSSRVGCVIVDSLNRIVSVGYNGPPRGVNDDMVPQTRPEKYYWFEHAERNAIYQARGGVEGCTLYVGCMPCADCARAIIQAGVRKVILRSREVVDRWKESCGVGMEMMKQAGVSVYWWSGSELKALITHA